MEFDEFAERAEAIETASADEEIVSLVGDLLAVAGADLPIVARFVQGRVVPAWDSTKLDVGPSLCHEAIARAAGPNVSTGDVERRLAETGEIGAVAASYDFGGQQGLGAFGSGGTGGDGLTVAEVAETLQSIAAAAGSGSQDRKVDHLFGLFTRASPIEARYLARLVLSEMRIGVGEGTVRDAIAATFDVPTDAVERALQVTNDYGHVAVVAREEGQSGLEDLRLRIGRPVQAMLAQTGTVADAIEEWGTVAVEPKYDGARVQVHHDPDGIDDDWAVDGDRDEDDDSDRDEDDDSDRDDGNRNDDHPGVSPRRTIEGTTAVYSRNMEDVTDPLPEVVEFVERAVDVPVILDGEVVAVDDEGNPRPFQEVLRRFRRKYDVEATREDVALEFHAFDCLHVDGEDLLDEPLTTRHDRLSTVLDAGYSTLILSEDRSEIEDIAAETLEDGHEGIMLKNPDSTYSPGKRGKNWLKRKPDVETLDLVVTGAEWGEGRRANLLGTFLLSARTDDGDFETIGKVATGITDEQLEDLTDLLEPEIVSQDGTEVTIRPTVVFEVGYEEIQRSPTYSSGYALRFPRFLGVREDKDPDDADSLDRVTRLAETG